jgi:hypothetical protein
MNENTKPTSTPPVTLPKVQPVTVAPEVNKEPAAEEKKTV